MSSIGFEDFLNKLTENLSDAELLSAKIKGEIAATISEKRQARGMSQKELAEFMGVSQGLVSRWETGETNFTIETLINIAQKLSIPMQCPYVRKTALRYSASGNTVTLPSAGTWITRETPRSAYSTIEELQEM